MEEVFNFLSIKMENKKGQSGGLVTGLVFGIASLVIAVVIALIIVSTLTDSDLLEYDRTTALAITNESFDGETQGIWLNLTTYTLASANASTSAFVITEVWNQTAAGGVLLAGNYTIDAATGIIQNASTVEYPNVTISYTFSHYDGESLAEISSNYMAGNLTDGIDEISAKLPTVLLIAAIVLILTVLAVLVGVWQRMRMGGGGI